MTEEIRNKLKKWTDSNHKEKTIHLGSAEFLFNISSEEMFQAEKEGLVTSKGLGMFTLTK